MQQNQAFYLLFLLAIVIHNIEEAIWLPGWSRYAKRYHKQVGATEFAVAVSLVTLLAILCTAAFLLFGGVAKYLYFGFLGAMMFNAFFPHLAATIALKRYAPGLASGVLLNLPINGAILYISLQNGVIAPWGLVGSTALVGLLLLLLLPLFFRIGAKWASRDRGKQYV